MRLRILVVVTVAIVLVLAATAMCTGTGSVESIHLSATSANEPLGVPRPASGAPILNTLVPNSTTVTPTVVRPATPPQTPTTGAWATPTPSDSDSPVVGRTNVAQSAPQPIVAS